MRIQTASRLLLLCLVVAVASCGFRLRGTEKFPEAWKPVYIDSIERFDDSEQAISVALEERDIPTGELDKARSRIHLLGESDSLRDVLVSAVNTQQLTIVWEFNYDLLNLESEQWEHRIRGGSVSESQTFSITGNANESNPEYRAILLELRAKLADKLIRALAKN